MSNVISLPLTRPRRDRLRGSRPRARTENMERFPKRDLRAGYEERVSLEIVGGSDVRPVTRGDCVGGERPCPWVSCRHHLALDVDPVNGSIKFNWPDREPGELEKSCSLDIADGGAVALEDVAVVLNVTRERVRQIEEKILVRMRKRARVLEEFVDTPASQREDARNNNVGNRLLGKNALSAPEWTRDAEEPVVEEAVGPVWAHLAKHDDTPGRLAAAQARAYGSLVKSARAKGLEGEVKGAPDAAQRIAELEALAERRAAKRTEPEEEKVMPRKDDVELRTKVLEAVRGGHTRRRDIAKVAGCGPVLCGQLLSRLAEGGHVKATGNGKARRYAPLGQTMVAGEPIAKGAFVATSPTGRAVGARVVTIKDPAKRRAAKGPADSAPVRKVDGNLARAARRRFDAPEEIAAPVVPVGTYRVRIGGVTVETDSAAGVAAIISSLQGLV